MVNCRMHLVAKREGKKKMKIKTQNEKLVEPDKDICGTEHMKKQLLESRRNITMYVDP